MSVLTEERPLMDPRKRVVEVAALSKCKKRQVGCVFVVNDEIVAEGFNHTTDFGPCEDAAGATRAEVVHAEQMALDSYANRVPEDMVFIYITQPPCSECQRLFATWLKKYEIIVVDTFIKFDTDKLRYDLVPPTWTEGDAEVLTHGAKKYKPNNWKEVDDIGRYIAALERHWVAFKKGEMYDHDSGLEHLKHLRTNAGFLLTLTTEKKDEN